MPRKKKPRGRPPKLVLPEPIDALPETIADVVLRAKPPGKWRYMENGGSGRRHNEKQTDDNTVEGI